MTCPGCGAEAAPDAVLCGGCGAELPAPAPGADPLIGTLLAGRFRVRARLGEGGFGAVYRAEQISVGRDVAIKVLHAALARDPHVVGRFRREARAACLLRDPHTVVTHDFGEAGDGTLYLVMELLRGRSLIDLLQGGPLPPERAARIAEQVCQSLSEAHAAGLVHRDIKPENVMVEERAGQADFVKVLDFGIAKIVAGAPDDSRSRLTARGQTLGSVEGMPPEQLRGEELDGRTDVYAVGVLLYRMLCGQPPFVGSAATIITAHLEQAPTPPRALRSEVPPAIERIVLRCLAKDRADRPQSAQALRDELRAALAGQDGLASTAIAIAAAARRPRVALPALALLIAVAAATALAIAGRKAPSPSPAPPPPAPGPRPAVIDPEAAPSPLGRAHEIFSYVPADVASAVALDLEALRVSALGPDLGWLIDPAGPVAPDTIDRLALAYGDRPVGLAKLVLAPSESSGRFLFVMRTGLPRRAVERAFGVSPRARAMRCQDAEYFHVASGHVGFLADDLVFGAGREPVCPDLGDRPLLATASAASLLAHAGFRGKPGATAVGYSRSLEREIAFTLDHPGARARVRAAARPSDCSDARAIQDALGVTWERPPHARAAPGSERICLLTFTAGSRPER